MKTIKSVLAVLPMLAVWLIISLFGWGLVFTRITDTSPRNKIVLCVDAPVREADALAAALEDALAGGVRMVKVYPFSYAMFDSSTLTDADLFIVPVSHVDTYREWFAPLPDGMRNEAGVLTVDGAPLGLPAFDPETGRGIAQAYVDYRTPEGKEETFYLLFGAKSLHVTGHAGSVDHLAEAAAAWLLEGR